MKMVSATITHNKEVPFITFIDENGKRIFKMIFEVLFVKDYIGRRLDYVIK